MALVLFLSGCGITLKARVVAECDFMESQAASLEVVDEIAQGAPWSDEFWKWLNKVQMNEELRKAECGE